MSQVQIGYASSRPQHEISPPWKGHLGGLPVYAPTDCDRTLYIYACNAESCACKRGSWTVLRSQAAPRPAIAGASASAATSSGVEQHVTGSLFGDASAAACVSIASAQPEAAELAGDWSGAADAADSGAWGSLTDDWGGLSLAEPGAFAGGDAGGERAMQAPPAGAPATSTGAAVSEAPFVSISSAERAILTEKIVAGSASDAGPSALTAADAAAPSAGAGDISTRVASTCSAGARSTGTTAAPAPALDETAAPAETGDAIDCGVSEPPLETSAAPLPRAVAFELLTCAEPGDESDWSDALACSGAATGGGGGGRRGGGSGGDDASSDSSGGEGEEDSASDGGESVASDEGGGDRAGRAGAPASAPPAAAAAAPDAECENGGAGWGGERYEKTPARTRFLLRFARRVGRLPEQCVRYEWAGAPLWPAPPPLLVDAAAAAGGGGGSGGGRGSGALPRGKQRGGRGRGAGAPPRAPPSLLIPRCRCGAPRRFELQLMPRCLEVLELGAGAPSRGSAPRRGGGGGAAGGGGSTPLDLRALFSRDGLDFLTVLVFSCEASCALSDTEFAHAVCEED